MFAKKKKVDKHANFAVARAKPHLSLPRMVLLSARCYTELESLLLQCLSERIPVTVKALLVISFPIIDFSQNSGGVLFLFIISDLTTSSMLHYIRNSSGISLRGWVSVFYTCISEMSNAHIHYSHLLPRVVNALTGYNSDSILCSPWYQPS